MTSWLHNNRKPFDIVCWLFLQHNNHIESIFILFGFDMLFVTFVCVGGEGYILVDKATILPSCKETWWQHVSLKKLTN